MSRAEAERTSLDDRAPTIPIVALDVPSAVEALMMARALLGECRFFKVGSELFTAAGPDVVRSLREDLGAEVFLDLKLHDIPNTVAGAVRSAARLGVRLLTVHASGGEAMLRAAAAAAHDAAGERCGVLGVTVLTSLDAPSLGAAWGREALDVGTEVGRLAGLAAEAGLHGIVCSGEEAEAVHAAFGARLALLVPGIRLAGDSAQDQRRVVTPAFARAAGARYVVLGRTVTSAPDPRAALSRAVSELAG